MKSNWWKILSIILLSWSLVAGLIVPLRTGITTVSPTQIKVGESVNLKVEGYNSAWGNAQKAVAWLHVDSVIVVDIEKKKFEIKAFAIKSKAFKAIDDRHLEFAFDIPRHFPSVQSSKMRVFWSKWKATTKPFAPMFWSSRKTTSTLRKASLFGRTKWTFTENGNSVFRTEISFTKPFATRFSTCRCGL